MFICSFFFFWLKMEATINRDEGNLGWGEVFDGVYTGIRSLAEVVCLWFLLYQGIKHSYGRNEGLFPQRNLGPAAKAVERSLGKCNRSS